MSEITEMAQAIETDNDHERAKVQSWRLHVLIEAGYPLPLAEKLADSEADLHNAVELVASGCAHETAARILLSPQASPGKACRRATGCRPRPVRGTSRLTEARLASRHRPASYDAAMKMEPIVYGDRKVFTVAAFNQGIAQWLQRLPTIWVEGEVTELRRQAGWQTVFFTLKDPETGACLSAAMPRGQFDALRLDLANGERVHVYGRPELWTQKGELRLRALSIERFGLGEHLAALERLKAKLAAEGLFAESRKRPLPRLPRRIGLVTGNDAAAKRDVLTAIQTRFPPAQVVVAETLVQGRRAAAAMVEALAAVAAEPEVDVVVLARGGGSFEDLLPFSEERAGPGSGRAVRCRS